MSSSAEALEAECQGMTKAALRKKAKSMGVSEGAIEAAEEEADEKAALIELVIKNMPMSAADKLAQECEGMTKAALRKKAKSMGVSEGAIEAAEEEAERSGRTEKAALIALILDAPTKDSRVPEPEPEPEPEVYQESTPVTVYKASGSAARAPAPSHDQLARTGTEMKLLRLVNDVQDISLDELDINDRGAKLEWPQICVVGGQAEGKSTLLSAIVSANMTSKMNFLPEGTGMVTRCPIMVQMTCPQGVMDHTATVSTQRRNGDELEEGDPDVGGRIDCPTAEPTPDELADWGFRIQQRITALQDHIVPSGQVTHQKIIVRLVGPTLPNLSLVDLPGLRASDDDKTRGLKEKLHSMVRDNLTSPNAIILCVGQAGTDPANWVGHGLAKEMDVGEERTIGVVTKADTLFGIPDTSLQSDNQRQIKRVLDDAGDTPFYAAYNPQPKDEAAYAAAGIDLKVKLEETFRQGRVGNAAIAKDLEQKLSEHLQDQLPTLYEKFKGKLATLDAELSTSAKPSWTVVDQVMLAYARLVQQYLTKVGDPDEVEPGFGLFDVDESGEPIWASDDTFQEEMTNLVSSFEDAVSPTAMYSDHGALKSVLHKSTADVLKDVARQKKPSLAQIQLMGAEWAKLPDSQNNDDIVAVAMGVQLSKQLHGLCGDVLGNIKTKLLPLCKEFYNAVTKVQFKLDAVDEGAQSEYTLYQVNKFGEIKRRLQASTDDLLKRNWQMIEAMARKNKVAPDAGAVAKSFLAIPDVQDALRRVCDMWQMPQQPEQQAPASILVRAPSRRAPDMESPPEGKCCKQKPTLGTWPSRYAMIKPNGSGGMGLYVYAAQGDRNPRATSIETLQGCTFMKAIENFTFSGDWFKLTIQDPSGQYGHFAFQDREKRDKFFDACTNLAAGRAWNKTAEQQAADEAEAAAQAQRDHAAEVAAAAAQLENDRLEAERMAQDEEDRAPAPEPQMQSEFMPEFERPASSNAEVRALQNGNGNPMHTGSLLDIGSKVFRDFYDLLKANPDDPRMTAERIDDEVRAESFRLWSLCLVRMQTQDQIKNVQGTLNRRFFDTASATGPFSATAIYGNIGLTKMVAEYETSDKPEHKKPPGPATLLKLSDGTLSERERKKKEAQQRTLREIVGKFERSGVSDFRD